jgi:hypothetical protein
MVVARREHERGVATLVDRFRISAIALQTLRDFEVAVARREQKRRVAVLRNRLAILVKDKSKTFRACGSSPKHKAHGLTLPLQRLATVAAPLPPAPPSPSVP